MGFGYDDLHEMWDGYREGLSALALLAQPPDSFFMGPDGIRTAWLESAAQRIPRRTRCSGFPTGGIPIEVPDRSGSGERSLMGAAQAAAWVWGQTGNFFLDHNYTDGDYDGFSDPWEEEIIAGRYRGVAQGQRNHRLGDLGWPNGWRRT